MKALIVVDIQNDFLPGGALAVSGGDEVIAVANKVQSLFDIVVATKDWHPPGHLSFAENHEGKKAGDIIELDGLEQTLWPAHCVQNTAGADFPANLEVFRFNRVFQKGTDPKIDSYSGFFDNGHKKATGLGDYLAALEVDRVCILGLATDVCVKHTALDAVRLDLQTVVIEDGCRGVELEEGDVERALDEMRAAGVKLVESGSLV